MCSLKSMWFYLLLYSIEYINPANPACQRPQVALLPNCRAPRGDALRLFYDSKPSPQRCQIPIFFFLELQLLLTVTTRQTLVETGLMMLSKELGK